MDPNKVDLIAAWKVPLNISQLAGFLGAAGYLAPDCANLRIPMSVLTPLTSAKRTWRWDDTHQRRSKT